MSVAQTGAYVADSESMTVSRNHDGWKRGIRVGSLGLQPVKGLGEIEVFGAGPAR